MNQPPVGPPHHVPDRSLTMSAGEIPRGAAGGQVGPVYPVHWQPREHEDEGFISPRFVVRALLQWWYVALPAGILLACISAVVVMLTFTPVYRASAMLKIASYTPYIAYTTNEHPMKPEEFTETQIELLRSPLVLEQLLLNPRIAELPEVLEQENPTSWLADALRVDQVSNSELYNVSIDAKSPENSAILVNAVLDEYFKVRQQDEVSQTKRVLELLEEEKKEMHAEIQAARAEIIKLNKDTQGGEILPGVTPGDSGSQLVLLNELRDRYTEANIQKRMLEARLTALKETLDADDVEVEEMDIETAVDESQEIQELRIRIARKKALLAETETVSPGGRSSGAYQRLEREIEGYERSLDSAAERARPEVARDLKAIAKLERQALMSQLEKELEVASQLEELLVERAKSQYALVGQSGDQQLELEFKKAELARKERVFEMIAERSMALTTESRAPGRVALMRPAAKPAGPVESLPLRNLAAAVLFSGCLPFGLALLWELSVRRIGDARQLSQLSSLPVVGEIARLPVRFRSLTPRGNRALNLFEESIDALRVGLMLPDQLQHLKVIAVASAVHNEGKSSISSQLAVSIGRSTNQPVLLIDGDLRAPDIHHIFDIPNHIGFATVLEGKADLDDAIVKTWSDTVHLLPAGQLKRNPHKLMSVGVLRRLLDQLRDQYQYIVIDTPPILSASEALLLAKVADGTVLSSRRNISRESQVRIAYERLMKAGARPLGAVFNGVPTRSYAQTYGSYVYSRSFE